MERIKEIMKRYKAGECSVKEQMFIRLAICAFAVLTLAFIGAVMDIIVWIRPIIESVVEVSAILLLAYEGAYAFWYYRIWAYGGVCMDMRKYYPYIQNAIFAVVSDVYSAIGVVELQGKSSVSSIGQKTFAKGKWIVYQFNLLLRDSIDAIDADEVKTILQNELIRKSEDGFEGITFDANGFPYLQVDSVLRDGAYWQVQIIVLWNEMDRSNYEHEQEKKRIAQPDAEVDDEVF